jgi:hypothetical protein
MRRVSSPRPLPYWPPFTPASQTRRRGAAASQPDSTIHGAALSGS